MALQLDVEPVAEDRGEPRATRRRKLDLAARDREVERAARPAGQRDQAFVQTGKHRELHMRGLARRRVEEGARGQPHQVAVAVLARGEQHDARKLDRLAAVTRRFLVAEIDRKRAADDRLDAAAGKLVGEFERAEHVVGVGQREGRLAVGLRELREARDRQRAFEQRIGRVHVQMHEAGVGHGFLVILEPASKLVRRCARVHRLSAALPGFPSLSRSRQPHRNVGLAAAPKARPLKPRRPRPVMRKGCHPGSRRTQGE